MQKRHIFIGFLLVAAIAICLDGCKKPAESTDPNVTMQLTDEELQGGQNGTIGLATSVAFSQPYNALSSADNLSFTVGRTFVHSNWIVPPSSTTAVDGLGPLYNATSCNACHIVDGAGNTPPTPSDNITSVIIRVSIPGQDPHGGPNPDPQYGLQIRNHAVPNAVPDGNATISYTNKTVTYPDGNIVNLRVPSYQFQNLRDGAISLYSPRIAPQIIGMALLEAVPEATILSFISKYDKDSISGKANYVWSQEQQQLVLGRFGWKANQPSVSQQVAAAFSGDIGITSPMYPNPNLTGQALALYGNFPSGSDSVGQPELPQNYFNYAVFYTEALAVPQRRNWTDATIVKGKMLFAQVSCAKCHIPQMETGTSATVSLASNQIIHPYTDLLLHDMGADLADGRPDYLATGSEWRTPPLWGIGLVNLVNNSNGIFLMHDGRARSIEEAILWHGGEANQSKQAFMKLSQSDRNALIQFVNDL
jgi:CxxC motif-containing protein (DUF1111 family)